MSLENLEKLPELQFVYSPKSEIASVLQTVERNKHTPYSSQGYKPRMPQGETLETATDSNELFDKIEAEITPEKLALAEKYKDFIRKAWPEIAAKLKQLLTEIDQPLPDSYEITFTDYGVGGRFGPPNKILIRFADEAIIEGLKNVIIHEAIHDAIEPLVRKHGTHSIRPDGHWVRELLVDRFMRKVKPDIEPHEMALKNLGPDRVQQIDNIFNQNYPNIEKILEEVSQLTIETN